MVDEDALPGEYKGNGWLLIGDWLAKRYAQFVLVLAVLLFIYSVIV